MASPTLRRAASSHLHRAAAPRVATHRSLVRLIAAYAAISLVPIIILGLILAWSYRTEARQRGLAEGQSEAVLVARTAVEPLLSGRPLSDGLSAGEKASMEDLVSRAIKEHEILRLRLHELKIDRSFIGDMLVNPAHAAIVRSIVDLGHSLHLHVVGERVESNGVWESLRASGCGAAPG